MKANRVAACPLKREIDLKKEGCGNICYRSDANSGIVLVRWFDNKSVQLVSTYSSSTISDTVKRWDQSSKRYILVPCPDIVKYCNSAMGVVDLTDMLTALYSLIKYHRWYLKVLIHCKINSWLLSTLKRNQMALLSFQVRLLMHFCMGVSLLIDLEDVTERNGRRVVTLIPSNCSRTDETGDWPVFRNKKANADFAKRALFVPLV